MPDATKLVLLRHATAFKNLEIRYGGGESDLLPTSYQDLQRITAECIHNHLTFDLIITTPRLQCIQTAEYLAQVMNLSYEINSQLLPASMGILDGLTIAEVRQKYPEMAERFDRWRNGTLEIHELQVPGMSDPVAYYQTGKIILQQMLELQRSLLVIGNRSILIALGNILLGRHPRPGGNYRVIPWHNCGMMSFEIHPERITFLPSWSTVNPY